MCVKVRLGSCLPDDAYMCIIPSFSHHVSSSAAAMMIIMMVFVCARVWCVSKVKFISGSTCTVSMTRDRLHTHTHAQPLSNVVITVKRESRDPFNGCLALCVFVLFHIDAAFDGDCTYTTRQGG